MFGTFQLPAQSRTAYLQHIALSYGVGFVKDLIEGSCERFAVVHINSAVLVYKYPQVPGRSLLFKSYVPEEKSKLFAERKRKLPYLLGGIFFFHIYLLILSGYIRTSSYTKSKDRKLISSLSLNVLHILYHRKSAFAIP